MSFQQVLVSFLTSHAGVILTCLAICWYLFVYLATKPKNFPPGPAGIPILGVALSIGKRPEETFRQWSKKYGDIIGFKVGHSYTVVLNSYELIQDALVKYSSTFNHRPNNYLFIEGLRKCGIAGSDYSADYMTVRNFTHGILGKLGFGKTALEEPIMDEVRYLIENLGRGKIELDTEAKRKIKYASGNILSQLAFGKRYEDYKHPEFSIFMQSFEDFFHTGAPAFNAALINPKLLKLPILKQSALAAKNGMDNLLLTLQGIIKEHKSTLDPDNPRDFIDEFLIEQQKDKTSELYSDKMLACIIRDMFGGGLETTEMTLIFSFLVLANRPHLLKKVHKEIDSVLGPDGKPRYALRDKLPYCHAVIKEIMRFRSVGPLLIPHAVNENVKFKGFEIPKGSTILPNVHAVHFSPKYWDNPEEFNPDRFLDENGKLEIPKYFLPFGIGPRTCIGRRLAEMEVFIFFVAMYQRFDVRPIPKPGCDRPWVFDEVYRTGLAVNPPDDTPVMLIRRINRSYSLAPAE